MIKMTKRITVKGMMVLVMLVVVIAQIECSKNPKLVSQTPAEIIQMIQKNLTVSGTAKPASSTDYFGMSTFSFMRWQLDLKVNNNTQYDFSLGKNMFLVESNLDGSTFEGVAVSRGDSVDNSKTSASRLGLSNYECRLRTGERTIRKGAITTYISYSGARAARKKSKDPEDLGFGSLAPGAVLPFKFALDQGTWINEEDRANMRIVLPQLELQTVRGMEKFRLIVYFQRPAKADSAWLPTRVETMHIAPPELIRLVETPETNLVTRVFAANWLAQTDSASACKVLTQISLQGRQGQLLATALDWLAQLKGTGLEEHAQRLLNNEETPNGIRNLAANYLGAVKYEPAFVDLVKAAKNDDNAVADGAISGLGAWGNQKAGEALLALLRNDEYENRHSDIAKALTQTGGSFAATALQRLAATGNNTAFSALVEAGLPESFDYFQSELRKNRDDDRRSDLIRGVRRSGGTQALPVLIELLKKEEPPKPDEPLSTSTLVDELVSLDAESSLVAISQLANSGNLRALQVLAGSKHEIARQTLASMIPDAEGLTLRIALNGLSQNWPNQSTDLLVARLNDPDTKIIEIAINGLVNTENDKHVPLILPLTAHENSNVCGTAGDGVETLGAKNYAPAVYAAILNAKEVAAARPLVSALIAADWQDPTAKLKLSERLAKVKGDMRYQVIRLMRYLSKNAMGPENYSEYDTNTDEWVKKWVDWANKP